MSRQFYTKFANVFKFIDFLKHNTGKDAQQDVEAIICYGFGGATLFHMVYTFETLENKIINVTKKYKYTKNGFTEFMVIDSKGNHYNVNNSLWLWKWDSIEDWNKIETNKYFLVKYYGIRFPLFGLFPNIIMSNQEKTLNSITSSESRALEG